MNHSQVTKGVRNKVDCPHEHGFMLVLALFLTLLLSALAAALTLVAASETAIAQNFKNSLEALHAADAAAERALGDLDALGDWSLALNGAVRSMFVDGPPSGTRLLVDGSVVDLAQIVNLANCHKNVTCTAAEMNAVSADRPWAANNPRWQLFLYGRLSDIAPGRPVDSAYYVLALVADDPSEGDGDPARDSDPPSPASGVVVLRAQAFGPRGIRRAIELTVARTSSGHVRVIAWRPH